MSRVSVTRNLSAIEQPAARALTKSRPTSSAKSYIDKQQIKNSLDLNETHHKISPFYHQAIANPLPMSVTGLNHFNITASPVLIEQLRDFYVEVVGLTVGPRARLNHDGYWLYAMQSPILHLSAGTDLQESEVQKEYFNHISIDCVGLESAIARMQTTKTPYRIATVVDTGQTQLSLKDPAGLGVELTFFNEKSRNLLSFC